MVALEEVTQMIIKVIRIYHLSVQNVVPIHLVNVEIFHWICENSDLLVLIKESSLKTLNIFRATKNLLSSDRVSKHFKANQSFVGSFKILRSTTSAMQHCSFIKITCTSGNTV